MSNHSPAVTPQLPRGTLATYVTGFILSIILTLTAYLLVTHHAFSNHVLVVMVAGLALIQFAVQAVCFLHLTSGPRPRWNILVFVSMITVVLILVVGSLWIMANLNYHDTNIAPAQQTDAL